MAALRKHGRECPGCGERAAATARFCGRCGADLARPREQPAALDSHRRVAAIAVAFAGTLLLLAAVGLAEQRGADADALELAAPLAMAVIGALAASALGRGGWRETVASPPTLRWLAIGAGVGLAGYAVNVAYAELLQFAIDEPYLDSDKARGVAFELLTVAVLPAVVEEWLCRGVLWSACRRVSGFGATLAATAALFALLHWLGGGLPALPHRFVFGLLMGWLRERSSSLGPGVVAHFLNNALAVLSAT
jgi:membrane protease YdiL (CAAX protease family)